MDIKLQLNDPFDGLTRVLQILRLSSCEIVGLRAAPRADGLGVDLTIVVPENRDEFVIGRLRQVIGMATLTLAVRGSSAASCPPPSWSVAA